VWNLTAQTESLFHTYSQFSTLSNLPSNPTPDELSTESEIRAILKKRVNLLSQLTRLLDSESSLSSSSLKQSNLSRHREILGDHERELARLRNVLQDARNRANLLSNVQSDIEAYRSRNPEAAEADYMLGERSHIDNSNSMADSVLSQAYAINENFGLQRETMANINRRIIGAAAQVPGLNNLIGRISAKKRRDGIIMGSFMAFCFLVFVFFL
jgi:Golgi SNAP receptor complex protein 1